MMLQSRLNSYSDDVHAGTGELVDMPSHEALSRHIKELLEPVDTLKEALRKDDLEEDEFRDSVRHATAQFERQLRSLQELCGIATGDNGAKMNINDVEIWAPLVNSLSSPTPFQREDAAGALSTFAAVDKQNIVAITAAGAIDPLIDLLQDTDPGVRGVAAGALKYLAETDDNQVVVASSGAIEPLVALLGESRGGSLQAAGALKNLAKNSWNAATIGKAGGVVPLVKLLDNQCFKVREEAVGALRSLAKDGDNKMTMLAAGAVERLVGLLDGTLASCFTCEHAAGTLKELAATSFRSQAMIVDAGAIPPLVKILRVGQPSSRRQALAALRSIADGSEENRHAILAAKATVPLIDTLRLSSRRDEEVLEAVMYLLGVRAAK